MRALRVVLALGPIGRMRLVRGHGIDPASTLLRCCHRHLVVMLGYGRPRAGLETQPLGRGSAGSVTAPVVARRRRRGRVNHELLDGRQVGAGVEEVAGVGPAQIMRRDGGEPMNALARPKRRRSVPS